MMKIKGEHVDRQHKEQAFNKYIFSLNKLFITFQTLLDTLGTGGIYL